MPSPGIIPPNIPPVGNDVSGSFVTGVKQTGYFVFNKNTLTAIVWIIVIGLVVYLATSSFSRTDLPEGSGALLFSRSFDMVVFGLLLLLCIYAYYSSEEKDRENILQWAFLWTRDFFNSPWSSFIETTIFAIIFYAIVYLFRIPRSKEFAPVSVYILEQKIWVVYLMLLIVAFFKYVLGIPIIDILMGDQWSNFWNGLPEKSPKLFTDARLKGTLVAAGPGSAPGSPGSAPGSAPGSGSPGSAPGSGSPGSAPGSASPGFGSPGSAPGSPGSAPGSGSPGSPGFTPGSGSNTTVTSTSPGVQTTCTTGPAPPSNMEVFNIANNVYSYSDASNVCAAYGAKLASYDQVEQAYTHGAEWCNYGWSQDQMAFFPTQKSTWLKYQATDDQKNDCGRPGVNGGYFDNPDIQFGVNCYGVKPKPSPAEQAAINAYLGPQLPPTKVDTALQDKLDKIRKKSNLNAFQYKKWSEY